MAVILFRIQHLATATTTTITTTNTVVINSSFESRIELFPYNPYLYPMCRHANSYQEFSRSITSKKGEEENRKKTAEGHGEEHDDDNDVSGGDGGGGGSGGDA
ncbi:hypothetical protein M0804_000369 [Polistes exclamans]|nr:hypothetical protein M0804_000369 [Polistes exclamans]